MKAAFITVHVGFNFGSKLQTIATQEVLKRAGCDEVECINYIPPRVTLKKYWTSSVNGPKNRIKKVIFFPIYIYSLHRYYRYLKRYCRLSKPIFAEDDFSVVCPRADVYVSGSDQLWNYYYNEGIDKHYFFDGIKGKKIAFGSSFGMSELPNVYAEYVKNSLEKYAAISVREDSAVRILKKIKIESWHVLDPTLMLNKEEWKCYSSKRLVEEQYLFAYLPYNIVNQQRIYESIRLIAKEKSLKVVSFSNFMFTDSFADETCKFTTPGDILSLFYYANIVVTNSFHGTAFSINLNKQFWVFMPSNYSTRIESILKLCSLSNRLLNDVVEKEQISEEINFDNTNLILSQERNKTFDFLTTALK